MAKVKYLLDCVFIVPVKIRYISDRNREMTLKTINAINKK